MMLYLKAIGLVLFNLIGWLITIIVGILLAYLIIYLYQQWAAGLILTSASVFVLIMFFIAVSKKYTKLDAKKSWESISKIER